MSKPARVNKKLNIARLLLVVFLVVCSIAAGATIGLVVSYTRDMPALENLPNQLSRSSKIFNADGTQQIASLHYIENREIVPLEQIPEVVREAFIATEDERFNTHRGVDIRSFFRALSANILHMRIDQGFSTITMQLAGNAFLDRSQKVLSRKLQEVVLAVQIERMYTKDDILEMYLNQVFLGYNAHGVQTAAQHYFGKDISEVDLAEAAILAGITRSPNYYSPHSNFEGAKARQETVLRLMVRNGYITQEEADAATAAEVEIVPVKPSGHSAAYFVDYVLQYLLNQYGEDLVYHGGLQVYTTLDLAMQEAAEAGFAEILDKAFPPKGDTYDPQAALIFLDPKTGHIKAMIGGRKHDTILALNRTLQPRQPGSAFKPIVVYAPAIAAGYSASTVIVDEPVTFQVGTKTWSPRNYDNSYRGPMSLREALARSVNIVAAKLFMELGVNTGVEFAQKLGITTLELENRAVNDWAPAISLGGLTRGVTPLELASAYGVFAAGGVKAEPFAILKVVDRNGKVLEENKPKTREVLDPKAAYLVTDMLKGTISLPYGTGTRAAIGRPAAGKTGTTQDDRDAWFVGYTPELVGAIWLGHDIPKDMGSVFGGNYPAQIWAKVMRVGHAGKPVADFPVPAGLVSQDVCTASGQLPGPDCPPENIYREKFIPGTEPAEVCPIHSPVSAETVQVCPDSHKLATPGCPIRITVPVSPWPGADGTSPDLPLTVPTEYCDLHGGHPGPDWPDEDDDRDNGDRDDDDQNDHNQRNNRRDNRD
ncbi:MAG: transglycosylase domain-containing protein [bacterium]